MRRQGEGRDGEEMVEGEGRAGEGGGLERGEGTGLVISLYQNI